MQVSSSTAALSTAKPMVEIRTNFTEKLSKDETAEIREQIKQNSMAMAFNSASLQGFMTAPKKEGDQFQTFLKDVGYSGKPIAQLSKSEAADLVSEDGFFGIDKTSKRLADFDINGAGGDEDKLRAGREGMLRGFKEAEKMWGGELPEISQKTMQKATEMVDKAMYDLGFSILNKEA